MSFQIQRGLFLLDFIDHHAILGISVDAETKEIRKRYLKIARRLHPDSFASESEEEKQQASEVLSKLVNPAWERLSQEKERTEYDLLLKLKGQQALQQGGIALSGLANQLMTASNPDHFYTASLKSLAEKQYEHLDQAIEMISQISELNLAYLMRKQKESGGVPTATPKRTLYTGSNIPDSSQDMSNARSATAPPVQVRRESPAEPFYRRAEAYAGKNNFAQAIIELRDALKLEPRNAQCHALMGMIYLKQKQPTMARIHFTKALENEPNNEMALTGKRALEQASSGASAATTGKQAAQKTPPKGKQPAKPTNPPGKKNNDKSGGGGLFGGLFGKKK